MPRKKRSAKNPTHDANKIINSLLADVLKALKELKDKKLTRPDQDGHRGLVPSFTMLTRTAFDLARHIEEREKEQTDKEASENKMPFEILPISTIDEWKKLGEVADSHLAKTTARDKQSS